MAYSRLHRTADAWDFFNTSMEHEMGLDKPSVLDTVDSDRMIDSNSEELISLDECDSLRIADKIQDVFFDFYGTNLPEEAEAYVMENLPRRIPNNAEEFEFILMKLYRKLDLHQYVDTSKEDEVDTPEDIMDDVNEIVDSGKGDDVDDDAIDETLDEDFEEARSQQSQAAGVKQLLQKASRIRNAQENVGLEGSSGGMKQRRTLAEIKADPRNVVYEGVDGIMEAYSEIVSDPTVSIWDVGLPTGTNFNVRNASDAFMSAGGESSGKSGGGWVSLIDSGSVSYNGHGLPIINCDNMASNS